MLAAPASASAPARDSPPSPGKEPACDDPRIVDLRRLNEDMDRAVLAAFGWIDIAVPPCCPQSDSDREALQVFADEVMPLLANVMPNDLDHALARGHGDLSYVRYLDEYSRPDVRLAEGRRWAARVLERIREEAAAIGVSLPLGKDVLVRSRPTRGMIRALSRELNKVKPVSDFTLLFTLPTDSFLAVEFWGR